MELPRVRPREQSPSSSRPRTSSIPRNYLKSGRGPSFLLEDALALLAQLRALEQLLSTNTSVTELDLDYALGSAAIQSVDSDQGFKKEQQYIAGKLHDLVVQNSIRRADGIPAAYVQAYKAALTGRPFVNETKIVDFILGREPTCSQALHTMQNIDETIGTQLKARFDAVYEKVKPFPLLRLPAELRLEIYSYHLPKPLYFNLLPIVSGSYSKSPTDLSILRTCSQIHREVAKYFYQHRVLWTTMSRTSSALQRPNEDTIVQLFQAVKSMSPATRAMFKKLEISIATVEYTAPRSRYDPIVFNEDEDPFVKMLELLSSVDTVLITFTRSAPITMSNDRKKVVEWVIDRVPLERELQWNFWGWEDAVGEDMVRERMKTRGGIKYGDGILQTMIARG